MRQPLEKIAIPVTDVALRRGVEPLLGIILEEVNLKGVDFVEGNMVEKCVKPNFRVMGKRFGKQMKAAAAAVAALSQEEIAAIERGPIVICVDGSDYELTRDDVEISANDMPGWSVASDGALTVALDIEITPELRLEGQARDIVRAVQNLRKTSGFNYKDRIVVTLPDTAEARACAVAHGEYIVSQVLADELLFEGDVIKVKRV